MDNTAQFELFQDLEKAKGNKNIRPEGSGIPDFRRHKKAIFLVIYSIIVLIIGFVLGVEHGKSKVSARTINSPEQTTLVIKTVKRDEKPQKKQPGLKVSPANSAASSSEAKAKFAIQLASFKNFNTAQRELAVLKNKGYSAYLVTVKGFSKLFCGPFKTKEEAQAILNNLKTRYPDCFITK